MFIPPLQTVKTLQGRMTNMTTKGLTICQEIAKCITKIDTRAMVNT